MTARRIVTLSALGTALNQDAYDWRFLPEAGKTFSDASVISTSCH